MMTKDEMRALLADLVPTAIADGRAYVVRRASGKAVRDLTNETMQVQTKPMRPMRMYRRQGVTGAGFKVQTFKPLQGVDRDHQPYPIAASNDATKLTPAFFCHVCDCTGADCIC